jgi:hypothetical protein
MSDAALGRNQYQTGLDRAKELAVPVPPERAAAADGRGGGDQPLKPTALPT